MSDKRTILIVDDEVINRKTLANIMSEQFEILQAENGREALKIFRQNATDIVAIILDLIMPELDGVGFLREFNQMPSAWSVPVIVDTIDCDSEKACLELGAWDFIAKPFDQEIIRFRVENAIERSRLHICERDSLTGLYRKSKFFEATSKMLQDNPDKEFIFMRLDIDRFNMVNSFYGNEEGDRLIRFMANGITESMQLFDKATYGRIEADVFCICIPHEKDIEQRTVDISQKRLKKFTNKYFLEPSIGMYVIEDNHMSVSSMYDHAFLAAKQCKGKYDMNYAMYDKSMSMKLVEEQGIINEMDKALENEQFVIYFQPKYDLQTQKPKGAEALVRWMHPKKGMVPPGDFIPVFEANGFVGKLDYYVWEKTCQYLRKWLDEGIQPYPVSVNVSRVDLYNPHLVESIVALVEKYHLPHDLLNLELTESAFILNQEIIGETMSKMQDFGFQVYMDDFGSGYSSLNVLKDLKVDVLKIDMKFLPTEDNAGRSEMILTSVVRMAKWLDIPVIMEGVESEKQVSFLQSIGCDYVQGFYFARPMPADEYEKVMTNEIDYTVSKPEKLYSEREFVELWKTDSKLNSAFQFFLQPVGIMEYIDGRIELIRTNPAFVQMMGYGEEMQSRQEEEHKRVIGDGWDKIQEAFRLLAVSGGSSECEYARIAEDGQLMWMHLKLQTIGQADNVVMVLGIFNEITNQKNLEIELRKYRIGIRQAGMKKPYLLIVDDVEMNRIILDGVFCDQYEILQAQNGKEALEILEAKGEDVEIVLLDLLMPVMDGREFLIEKNKNCLLKNIPVVVISTEDSEEMQLNMLELGVNDYITKPFVSKVVKRRVNNVLEFKTRFRRMVQEYSEVSTDN